MVKDCFKVGLGVMSQGSNDIVEGAIGHDVSQKQLRVLECLIGRLEPNHALGYDSEVIGTIHRSLLNP